eukprot:9826169-Karenia_brevis.AAC.1
MVLRMRPWTSTVLAVWQWAEAAPYGHSDLCADVKMRYAMCNAHYRLFCSLPHVILPHPQSV